MLRWIKRPDFECKKYEQASKRLEKAGQTRYTDDERIAFSMQAIDLLGESIGEFEKKHIKRNADASVFKTLQMRYFDMVEAYSMILDILEKDPAMAPLLIEKNGLPAYDVLKSRTEAYIELADGFGRPIITIPY